MRSITFTNKQLDMLRIALNCAGRKGAPYYLNGVHVTNTHVEATDGARVVQFKLETPRPPNATTVIIPVFKINITTSEVRINIEIDGRIDVVQVNNKGIKTIERLNGVDGKFPDLSRVTPSDDAKVKNTETPLLNPLLLGEIFKGLRGVKFPTIRLINNGPSRALRVQCLEFPELLCLLMPARELKK